MAELTEAIPVRGNTSPYISNVRKPISYYLNKGAFWVLVALILIYTLFPFYWAIATSLKRSSDLFTTPVPYWPSPVTWDNYRAVFEDDNFVKALRNSAIVSVSSVVLALVAWSLAAYAIGRFQFRGKTPIMYLILSMTMFPSIAILGSLYDMIRWADQFNTLQALVFSYTTFTLPFMVWVLANFFRAMPAELEQAALVDGATPFRAFYQVMLPLAMPGMATTGLLAFIASWNEYLFARTFTITPERRTVPVAIASFGGQTQYDLPWGTIMAASVVVTVPLIVLVLLLQRKIIAGLTAGAVKG